MKIGVIGCGARSGQLLGLFRKLHPEIDIAAATDIVPEAAQKLLAATAEQGRAGSLYPTYRELVQDKNIDWVFVGTPNHCHREHVLAAFNAGKHVYCEKPLATTLNDCLAMWKAQRESRLQLMIGFTLRYSPHFNKIKQLVDQGAIGSIVSIEFNETLDFNHGGHIMMDWRRFASHGGGHLLEKCCHDMDIVNWLVGSRVRYAASFGGNDFFRPENAHHAERIGPNAIGGKAYQSWHPDRDLSPFTTEKTVVDNQVAIMEFENQVRATFHTNMNAGIPERRLYILGTEGAIQSNVLDGTINLKRIGFTETIKDESTGAKGGHGDGDPVLCDHFAKAMLESAPPITGVREGLESAAAIFGIEQARIENRIVDLAPIWARIAEEGAIH